VKLIEEWEKIGGTMDGADLMRKVAAGFEKSDLQPLLEAMHEEIVWKTASKQEGVFRFGGEYKGRAGILDVLAGMSMDYTFCHLRPKEIFAKEDVVWGLFDAALSIDPKGKLVPANIVNLDMAIHWRLKDGKIIEHQAFFDTAALLMQQGRLSRIATQPQVKL
jgi:ketosteroid isomerase-like protein